MSLIEETPLAASVCSDDASPRPQSRRWPWFQYRFPHRIEWNRIRLGIAEMPAAMEGLRILHLTDLHLREFWSAAYDRLLAGINRRPPDLLLFTGDFVESKWDCGPALPIVRRMVAGFSGKLGCFGICGNHDGYNFASKLAGSNIRILNEERCLVPVGGDQLELIALPGVRRQDLSPEFIKSLPAKQPHTPRVVLSHYPDHLRMVREPLDPDLILAGHTHGGQICLPGGWPISRHDSLPRRLCTGVHRVGRTWLVANRGLGFTILPFRVFCPAEVIEIELTGSLSNAE